MNNLLVSFTGGFLTTLCLFVLCFIIVSGIKIIYFYIISVLKKKFIKEPVVANKNPEPAEKPKHKPTRRKPIRSIEINPDEVDRIYVKKVS